MICKKKIVYYFHCLSLLLLIILTNKMPSLRELEDYMEILDDKENKYFKEIKEKKKKFGWVGQYDLTKFYNNKLFRGQIAKSIAKKLINELIKTIYLHDIGKEFADEVTKDLVKVYNILLEKELSEKEIVDQCPFKMLIKKLKKDKVANEIAKKEVAWEKLHLSLNQYVTLVYIENEYFDKIKEQKKIFNLIVESLDDTEQLASKLTLEPLNEAEQLASKLTLEPLNEAEQHNLTSFYNIKLDQEQLAKKIIRKLINELVKIFFMHDIGKEFAEELNKDIVKMINNLNSKELSEQEIANQCPFKMLIKKLNRDKLTKELVKDELVKKLDKDELVKKLYKDELVQKLDKDELAQYELV